MHRFPIATLALCALLLPAGCSRHIAATQPPPKPAQPVLKAAPPTPLAEKKEELGTQTWNPAWDRYVEEALPPEMLSARAARVARPYCPRFAALSVADKRAFWAYLFQAMAGAEAGLTPTTDVRHTEPAVAKRDTLTHRMIRSEGLLQLTYMDADRYGCDFNWQHDKTLPEKDPARTILQPKNNLTCGVKILDNQLFSLRKPLLSRSSYWSTLQPGTRSFRVFNKQMSNVPSVCRAAGTHVAEHSQRLRHARTIINP